MTSSIPIQRLAVALIALLPLANKAMAQEPPAIPLWPHGAPGSEGKTGDEQVRLTEQGEHIVSRIHRPSITPYLPAATTATGAAVVVIPGGGHRELWMDHEGYRVGRWLSEHGIAAFVLKYRLAREQGSTYTVERDALADAQRAIRMVRSRASEWGVASDRIGVMGFSAGGELAALAGTRYGAGTPNAPDPMERESSQAAFMGLIYPSIPKGLPLSKETAPAFLLSGENDSPAIADGVAELYLAIRHAGGSAALHVLPAVGHGFGIRDNNPRAVAVWPSIFLDWLDARGLLGSRPAVAHISSQMSGGIAAARPVPVYTVAERAHAAQQALGVTAPSLGTSISLTPNTPYGQGDARLSVWKPSFVLGTASGGEVGINFWGIHNEGHVNVGFTSSAATWYLLDCRLLSAGAITYKVYGGAEETLRTQGTVALSDNHLLLMVTAARPDEVISVELWPTPVTETMGFLGCDLGPAVARDAPAAASPTVALADAYLVALAKADPETGSVNDLPGADHGALSDNTAAGTARWEAQQDSLLAQLRAVRVGASDPDRVLYGVLRDELERSVGARVCRKELWGVASYVNGWQAALTDLARVQPVGTEALRALALRRAHAIPRYVDNEIELLKRGLREGYSSPKVIVGEVIAQLDGLLALPPGQSPFSAPTLRDTTPAFRAAYQTVVRDEINPAVRRYRDYLQTGYLPATREALGVSANKNGRACYDAAVRQFSTVSLPADSVYQIGRREIRRIDEEMRPLAKRLTGSDDVSKAMRMVTTDPRFAFRSDTEIIAYAQAAQDRARAAMPRAFGFYTEVPVQIQPYPEFRARAGAPGQYQPPPEDNSRPPIHLLNTWDPTHKSRASVQNTTFHETWPGHHQQGMVARGATGQHRLLRVLFNSGFGEGWGLYAERVADELGLYSGDLDRFGYLASQKFRAARMVLDAGIHTRGMGYDEAIAFLEQQSTRSASEVRGEINRYISWPGQAPSYMIGNLEILRLREEAKAKLGGRFDMRAFHDQALGHRSITLPVLRALITEWIAKTGP